MDLEAYLPANLRKASTTITKIAAGLSGAGVYRVDPGEQAYVLKISLESTLSLSDFYQRMWAGSLNIVTGEGQWWFGLALVRESSTL